MTTDIIDELYKVGELTEALQIGVLTAVYENKGLASEVNNNRGITIPPTIKE